MMRTLLRQLPDDLRAQALAHPAFAPSRRASFERLEFLGDSVLDLAITDALFRDHPGLDEGEMSRVRAATVSREACADVARDADLGGAMVEAAALLGETERASAERLRDARNALAALCESVIGAAFLHGGWEAVAPAVVRAFRPRVAYAFEHRIDPKSRLLELASRAGGSLAFAEEAVEGPPHERRFTMSARWEGEPGGASHEATGTGRSKQEAQQRAAAALLELVEG